MAVLLSCQCLKKSFGTRVLFDGLTFGVHEGERLGLIGPNGSGKSTLIKMLAGIEEMDGGTLVLKRQLRMGYVPQEDSFEFGSTATTILAAALEGENLEEHEHAYRIDSVFTRVGFARDLQVMPVERLSGGWRKRVAIARELVREPELLLMDEPTNHLDLEGILWLEKFLASAPFACLMISHDRYFLENAANRVFELNRCYPDGFYSSAGRYSDFLIKREEFLEGQQEQQRALQGVVKREIEWLRRGAHGRTTKQKGRINSAGRLIDELADVKQRNNQGSPVRIDFTSSDRKANKLVVLKNVEKSLGERKLISGLNLILSPGMKLGLLGQNGSGKTTFLRLLTGELEPDSGTIERAEKLRIVYFDQSREQLDKEVSLRRALAPTGDTVWFRDRSEHVASWAKRFLFKPEQLEMPVKSLSGGEQARILIANLMLRPADILLLDEPTNDLDIPSLEVLEESLSDFPGALVLITHDRYMLTRLATDILGLDGKGGNELFTDYTQWQNAQNEARSQEADARKTEGNKGALKKEQPKSNKRLSYKEQLEWDKMEAAILEGEEIVQGLLRILESPEVAGDPKLLMERCHDLSDAQAKVDGFYARWAELEEKQK